MRKYNHAENLIPNFKILGDLIWWTPEDAGFICHIVATISEWIIVFLILLFILSYTKEFAELEFEEVKFKIKDSQKY